MCMSMFEDLTGKTIGNLTVITRMINNTNRKGARWLCKCNKCNRLIATRTDVINSSSYKVCNHGDELEIPNWGKILKFINDDFYSVQVNGHEHILRIATIVENCKYKPE